jgi:uncharacterized membrane protein
MTENEEQQAMDAFWQECQENMRRHEVRETAIKDLLETCREIVQAEDEERLPERLPSMVHCLRRALGELDEVI